MKEIEIDTEFIKLDQFLKLTGLASTGGHAKMLISEGQVKVNGEINLMRGKKLRKDDEIQVAEDSFKII